MIEKIRNSMFKSIKNEFPNVVLYQDAIPQGFETPCFYIQTRVNKLIGGLGIRSVRELKFVIHYFPLSDILQSESFDAITDKLMYLIQFIDGDETQYRYGYDIESNITDNVLQVFVSYRVHMQRILDKNPMQTLDHTERMKE